MGPRTAAGWFRSRRVVPTLAGSRFRSARTNQTFTKENVMPFSLGLLRSKSLVLVCLILLAGTWAFAQSTFGTFVGTVQDQSGSVIGGAIVTITNLDENAV